VTLFASCPLAYLNELQLVKLESHCGRQADATISAGGVSDESRRRHATIFAKSTTKRAALGHCSNLLPINSRIANPFAESSLRTRCLCRTLVTRNVTSVDRSGIPT